MSLWGGMTTSLPSRSIARTFAKYKGMDCLWDLLHAIKQPEEAEEARHIPGHRPFFSPSMCGNVPDGVSGIFAHSWETRRCRFIAHIADLSALGGINLTKWGWIFRRGEGGWVGLYGRPLSLDGLL